MSKNNIDKLDTIGFFETIMTEISLSLKEDMLQEEIIFLSKAISVALFLDKKVTIEEYQEAIKIVKEEMGENWEITWKNVLIYIEKYRNEETKWLFSSNKEKVFTKIIVEKRYKYAKFLLQLLENNCTEDDEYYLYSFSQIIKEHEELLEKKGF